jgi:anti-anti-sigma regulatory factor
MTPGYPSSGRRTVPAGRVDGSEELIFALDDDRCVKSDPMGILPGGCKTGGKSYVGFAERHGKNGEMAGISCAVSQVGTRTLIRLTGDLCAATVPQVRTALLKCLVEQPDAVIAELAGLQVRDPLALGVFGAVAQEAAMWPGTPLLLSAPGGEVAEWFATRRYGRMQVLASTDEAFEVEPRSRMPWLADSLLPVSGASAHARRLAEDACARWGLPHLADPARIVAGELVANAIVHAGTMIDLRFSLGRFQRAAPYVEGPLPGSLRAARPLHGRAVRPALGKHPLRRWKGGLGHSRPSPALTGDRGTADRGLEEAEQAGGGQHPVHHAARVDHLIGAPVLHRRGPALQERPDPGRGQEPHLLQVDDEHGHPGLGGRIADYRGEGVTDLVVDLTTHGEADDARAFVVLTHRERAGHVAPAGEKGCLADDDPVRVHHVDLSP